MTNKSIFLSKTFWIQIIAIVVALFPPVTVWLKANPVEYVAVFAAINILVRFATSGRINVFADGETGGPSGGVVPLWLLAPTAAGIMGLLPSCGVTMDAKGKPTFALDPVALAQIIQDWQRDNDAKDANVIIVRSPAGDNIVATKPNGTVITELVNPAGVFVKPE
jgi:hypothetical protein